VAALVCGAVLGVTAVPSSAAGGTSYGTTPKKTWQVTGGQIYAMVRIGDKVVVGGNFTAVRSSTGETWARNRLAIFSASTGAPQSGWNPGADNSVRALATDGTRVFAGGSFTHIGGLAKANIAALSLSTGKAEPGFTANGNGEVRGLLYANSKLYAGGLFTTINNVPRTRAAAVSPVTGVLDGTWKPVASWAVNSIVPMPGTTSLVLGGEFSVISTFPRKYLAMVNRSTGAVLPWAPAADCIDAANPCIVRSVAATPSLVYAAVGGIGGQLSAYNVSNGVRKWTQHGDGDVQAVAVSGNTVFAGGHFDPDFGPSGDRYELAAMNAATGAMLPYGPQLHGGTGVWAILAGSDSLLVGGLFTMISGTTTTAKNFAQFPLAP
jgi:hypothetical protein